MSKKKELKPLLPSIKKLKPLKMTPEQIAELKPIEVTRKTVTISSYVFETQLKAPGDVLPIPKAEFNDRDFGRMRIGLARYAKRENIELELKEDEENRYVIRKS